MKLSQGGQTLTEYVIILALIVLVAFGALNMFTAAWGSKFSSTAQVRTGPSGMYP